MPPVPKEIIEAGGRINFVLTGPLAQAQRRILELEPALRTIEALAGTAEALGPEVMDVINKDETAEFIAESGNIPQRLLNNRDTRAQIRADRQARQQAILQQQAMLEAAKAAPGVSGPVDETSIISKVGEAIGA
jgi:hypothetical protein